MRDTFEYRVVVQDVGSCLVRLRPFGEAARLARRYRDAGIIARVYDVASGERIA